MSPNPYNPPLHPSVDEVHDGTDSNDDTHGSDSRLSWPQICTQHDSVLSSHLKMLRSLKTQVSSDPDAYRLISSMIERTQKLVMQFEGVKKHMVSTTRSSGFGSGFGSRAPSDSSSRADDVMARKRRKRCRISNEIGPVREPPQPVLEVQPAKRKRVDMAIPGANQDVRDVMPVSLETEDISDEVQRRLKIKEEQRRRRVAKPEKRKRDRDSLASNASTSSLASAKPRKRFKLGEQIDRSFPALLSHSLPNTSNPPTSLSSAMAYRNVSRRFYHNDRAPSTSGTASQPRAQGQGNQTRANSLTNRQPPNSNGPANLHQGQGNQSLPYTQIPNNVRLPHHHTAAVQPRLKNQELKKRVCACMGPAPVKRPTDLDNDTTMTGMPFPYTRDQWRQIQRIKKCREQEEQRRLRVKHNQNIDLNIVMTDTPALRTAPVRACKHMAPCRARRIHFFDVEMLDA
ncbi:hypothetical protein BDW66DRAFT_163647 [Aspergillus desertorum]